MSFENCEPISFEKAIQDQRWKDTMEEEIKVVRKNDIWKVKSLPKEKNTVEVKWVLKKNAKGEEKGYKTRLVAKGYKQQQSIHYVNNKLQLIYKKI